MSRIYKVQVNIDDMFAELDVLRQDQLHEWLSGFRCGCRGRIIEGLAGPSLMGAEFGLRCHLSAEVFRQSRISGGKARQAHAQHMLSTCSAHAQHMLSTCSAHAQHVPQHVPQLSNIQYPISNNEVSNNQKPKDNISSADAVGELFEEFWDAYDRKDGRAAAEKAWRRLTSEEKQLAADNAPAMREAQPDRKYRPMPATYLNGKRWLDQSIHEESQPVRRAESYCEKPSAEGIAEGKRLQYLLDAGLPI